MMCKKVPLRYVMFETKSQCSAVDCCGLSGDVVTKKLYWKAQVIIASSENGSSLNHVASTPGMWKNCSTGDSGWHEW